MSHFAGIPIAIGTGRRKEKINLEIKTYRLNVLPAIFKLRHYPVTNNFSLCIFTLQFRIMKFGVVVFPGSNCDRDMHVALSYDLQQEVIMLWHKDKDLDRFTTEDCIILPGGFSFGDYLRCGAIARFSPMMQSVIEFANAGGKVLGVCNGFQILCESGLLPGALLRNANQQFVCKNIFIGDQEDNIFKLPVAHG